MYFKTITIEDLISSLIPIPFCILTIFVIAYYIRRRYKLNEEIRRIPQDLLILESYKNYLKNLKIKCIINNFILLILVLEFSANLGESLHYLPFWLQVFDKGFKSSFINRDEVFTYLLSLSLRFVIVPVLCLMMNFLWLAYRKYEYKYILIRWIWYILLRTVVIFLSLFVSSVNLIPDDYSSTLYLISSLSMGFLQIIDFLQYVHYTRKFYLHLRSQEKEIKLFYNDHIKYIDCKYLRIHFKIATIMVTIALFFFTFGGFIVILKPLTAYSKHLPILQHWSQFIHLVLQSVIDFVLVPSLMFYKLLITLNYSYIFVVVVYKSSRDRQKLIHINNYIKPIISQYHKSLYHDNYVN